MRIREDLWVRKDLRLVRYPTGTVSVHWAYYQEGDDEPVGLSAMPYETTFDSIEDIEPTRRLFTEALTKPVLDYNHYNRK